jgi:ribonucleoside-triphosphate reductase
MSLPEWDKIQKRDRLTGVSLTGIMDAVDALGLDDYALDYLLKDLNNVANTEALEYAKEMRIPAPLLTTCIKPSGSISQLPTVSSGVHRSYAPFYIRRVRISSSDPLAKVMLDLGFPVYPEAGQGPTVLEFSELSKREQINALEKANTWVIEFPVKTAAKTSAAQESAIDQFQRYLMMQRSWTDHNSSVTIYFSEDEIEPLVDEILKEWDNYIAVSFLPKDNMIYPLMPYEEISESEYLRRANLLQDVTPEKIEELLTEYEREDMMSDLLDSDCGGGSCPIR